MYRRYLSEIQRKKQKEEFTEEKRSDISTINGFHVNTIKAEGQKTTSNAGLKFLNISLEKDKVQLNKDQDMDAEIKRMREESLERLNGMAVKVADEKGVLVKRKDVDEHVQYICSLFGSFADKMAPEDLQKFRSEVASVMVETNILTYLKNNIIVYPADVYSGVATYKDTNFLYLTLTLISYYTCSSETFTEAVASTDMMVFWKNLLEKNSEGHLNGKLTDILEKILRACIDILHNVAMWGACVEKLQHLGFTKALQSYLQSPDDDVSLTTMAIIAHIADEEECGIIATNVQLVAKLLYFLQKGMEDESSTYEGWSCKKSGRALRNLAKNDANKKLLWNLNVLHTLVKMAKTGDEKEQLESVHAIWALCFDEDIRRDVVNDKDSKVVNVLKDLENNTTNESIKNACTKCLWTLNELSTSTDRPSEETVKETPQSVDTKPTKGHIMISYQSQNREILLKIKGILEEKNYKVWMDIEQIGGSTLQSMAEGIENALVVLICYSRKYKESENCRLEAEYTQELRKPFIPLKMEQGYKPDGWLGLMIGSRYFVEFSGKYKFEVKLLDLFRELDRILKPKEKDAKSELHQQSLPRAVTDTVITNTGGSRGAEATVAKAENARNKIKYLRQWNLDDVFRWLSKHNLQNQGLDQLTGEEIWLLAKVMCESPAKIYDFLERDLKVDRLLTKSRLVWALEELVQS